MDERVRELERLLEEERAERRSVEQLLDAERRVLEGLGEGADADAVLLTLIETIEAHTPGAKGSVVFLDGDRIYPGPAPSLDPEYTAALEGLRIGPEAGSCGSAAYLGVPVYVADARTDPRWAPYRDLVHRYGFSACWSIPIRETGGEVLGTFAVYRDEPGLPDPHTVQLLERAARLASIAMERTRMLERLRETSERLTLIHQAAPVGIVLTVMESGRVLEVNDAWLEMVGRTRDEVVGRSTVEMELYADFGEREEMLRELRSTGEVRGKVVRLCRPDGSIRHTRFHVHLVEVEGVRCAVSLQRDITQELEAERKLRRAERLATVGTLVGGVAHELNNPLAAIQGFSELLLQSDGLVGEFRETLELIHRESERMSRVVSDLRVLARESHDPEPGAAVDVNEAVRHVVRIRSYALDTGNIRLVVEPSSGQLHARVNRSDVEQVLLNLITNAEHAITDGGAIGEIRVRTEACGDRVVLRVADTGPGIAPEHLERIFDPFFTTKAPGKGMGLGMSLVQKLVQEAGGEIRVRSEVGEGVEVEVEYPAVLPRSEKGSQGGAVGAVEDLTPSQAIRILVVDDEPAIRRLLDRMLSQRGHSVVTARDGGEALEVLAREGEAEYDLILSDLRMPGLSGGDLLARLRERGKGEEGRLVFMTGDNATPAAAETLRTSGVPWLLKPFALPDLLAHVRRAGEVREPG